MRDKLLELIRQHCLLQLNLTECTATAETSCAECLADYLLANGVILPPCKVGDTVYAVGYREIYAGTVIEIKSFETEDGTEKTYHAEDDGYPIGFTDEDFGKTVFLTREEAERALREVQGDA